MAKQPAVYIITSKRNGTLYVGVTSNLVKCIWEHKNGVVYGFSKRYSLDRLVYFELFPDIQSAIVFEKRIKKWRRVWKIELIEKNNFHRKDLWDSIVG
jgi:putative endonuclease